MNQKKGGISVMGKVSMPQGKGSQLHNRREYEKINSGFWGILAETTGRETQVSCSVGGDGITQKKQKSRALRGGDLRSKYYPVP